MTSAQSHTRMNSKSVITGEFPFVSFFSEYLTAFPSAYKGALEDTVAAEHSHLSERMSAHPDWVEHAPNADVSVVGNHLEYGVSANKDKAKLVEYGDPSKKVVPTGLLRSTALHRSYGLKSEFSDRISNRMIK